MHDLAGLIAALHRPRLLVQAARFGVDDYRRTHRLPRLLRTAVIPGTGPAILALIEIERELNDQRRQPGAPYSPAVHVDVLIALLGEARALRAQIDVTDGEATGMRPEPRPSFPPHRRQEPVQSPDPVQAGDRSRACA